MPPRTIEQEFDTLKADFSKLSSDLANLTEVLRDLTGQGAQASFDKLRAAAGNGVDAAAAHGRDGVAAVMQQVRERPLASILVCFGLGLVIGKLIDR
jgi:ElaB/YqjD/DUF883 family membrane-anchored ribosome-binding protein